MDLPVLTDQVIVVFIPGGACTFPVPTLSTRQIVCGPSLATKKDGGYFTHIQTPSGFFDAAAVLSVLAPVQMPEAIIVWADCSRTMFPQNLGAFSCPKLLMVGDTHHQKAPLQTMMIYADCNPFNVVLVAFRQHLHLFREAGYKNAHWLQGPMTVPLVLPIEDDRARTIVLLGNIADRHPQRRRIYDALDRDGYPLHTDFLPHEEAMRLYGQKQISLNVSLNGDMNYRPFEVMGAGGFLVTDRLSRFSGLDTLFEEDVHYVAFGSVDELKSKLDYYLDRPQECLRIARQGQERYLQIASRAEITRRLWDLIRHGRSSPPFEVDAGERPSVAYASAIQIMPRVALYETAQDYHLTRPKVSMLFLPGAPIVSAFDCADLPRIEIAFASPDGNPAAEEGNLADYASVSHLTLDAAMNAAWTIVVAPNPVAAKTIAASYKADAIVISDTPWSSESGARVDECPEGFEPSALGYTIFRRDSSIDNTTLSTQRGEIGANLFTVAMSVGIREKRVLQIGSTAPRSLVIDELGASSWTMLVPPDENALLPDMPRFAALQNIPEYELFEGTITDLPEELHGRFDLIYVSPDLPDYSKPVLASLADALRRSGVVYIDVNPPWFAHDGHALPKVVDSSGREFSRSSGDISPWGHLLMDEDELLSDLRKRTDDATARKIVELVYRSPRLNRFSFQTYCDAFKNNGFRSVQVVQHSQGVAVPDHIYEALVRKHPDMEGFEWDRIAFQLKK